MVILKTPIKDSLSIPLEEYFCENNCPTWGIEKINDRTPSELFGYFDSPEDAQREYCSLRGSFPELPQNAAISQINECDWKNEYKKFLTSWSFENLHWVPAWMKDSYKVPEGHKVLYFDAGLAFGTGTHPTTSLCLEWLDSLDLTDKTVLDYGCGSGILAIAALKLGAKEAFGVDIDPQALEASKENAKRNGVLNKLTLCDGKKSSASLTPAPVTVANILCGPLADLEPHITKLTAPDGLLALSGILTEQAPEIIEAYSKDFNMTLSREKDGWALITGQKK